MTSALVQGLNSRVARALARRWSAACSLHAAGWTDLHRELDHWHDQTARFWWRDDDAISATGDLHRLLGIRDKYGIPLAVAAIPAGVTPSLGAILKGQPDVEVFAHGWNHENHGRPGKPSGELTSERIPIEVSSQLALGRSRLEDQFGRQFRPVLVPPHNHLARHLVESVRQAGFSFVSIDGDFSGLPIPSRNVHLDVIDWEQNRGATRARVVGAAIAALRVRRFGLVKADSPIGLLTHHLVHDEPMWATTVAVLDCLQEHPAVRFPTLGEIFR